MNWGRKLIGFRSRTGWKMFLASLFYTFLILFLLSFMLPESEVITNIAATGVFISILALIVGLIKPKLVLPRVQYQSRRKVLYTYIYLFLFCFFMVGLLGETQVVEPSKTNEKSTEMLAAAEEKVEKQKALEEKAKEQEAERKAQEEAAAKQEAERKAQEEAAAKQEAEREAQEQAAAKQEAERKAQEEAAAKQEAERKAQEQAAAKQEAERKAQEHAAAKQEAERKAQEQAAAKQEAERKAQTAKSSGTSGNGEAFVNDPSDDKESNLSCKGQIKGNMNSKIYHMPGGAYYDKTQDDIQWFCSPKEAEKAGFRASKR
ncbi:hypothetical protein GS18_0201410 [Metabacillus indicus]|uniref:Protein TolA n=2 Tax=Metabacillus indicus TaxID=246786 RepID=A0A084H252_METID|nr:hypothetical protein GS18_0201410 [Metabacillus indicus]